MAAHDVDFLLKEAAQLLAGLHLCLDDTRRVIDASWQEILTSREALRRNETARHRLSTTTNRFTSTVVRAPHDKTID